ncbi:putative tail tip protein [Vibrio phage Phriendly]|nr:putative tail tip protein [Vibrio phage Phriendly]
MSSRADMIGSGPSSGLYKPSPTPTEDSSMPVYINDELLSVGGVVNGILEGGAFPPQGKMPVRWREGMMMYFIEPLEDTYVAGEFKGQKIITSAGIWLYRRKRWWKIVDDPSNIIGAVFAYRLTADGSPPSTPNPSSYPPSNWEETAPTKSDKSEWIWITMSSAYDENTDTHTWTQPTPFSAGVADGQDGLDGAPGLDGRIFEQWFYESPTNPGIPNDVYPPPSPWVNTPPANPTNAVWMTFIKVMDDGTDPVFPWSFPQKISGEDGKRGSINISVATTGSVWSNLEAYNAITNDPESNGIVQFWDTVTLYNESEQFSEQRYYAGGTGASSTWNEVALFVDGDAIVDGTIRAEKMVANTITADQIAAGTITGNEINSGTRVTIGGTSGQDVVVLDAQDANSRIWVGNTLSLSAAFRVTPDGTLYANNGFFNGTLVGNIGSNGGHLEGSAISVPTIASPKFHVDSAGNMTCTDARVTGDITGSSGTFNGDIYAENIIGGVTSSFVKPLPVFSTTVNANTWVDVATINITNTYPFDRSLSITGLENGLIRVHVQSAASGGTNYEWRLYSPSLNKTYYIISGTAKFPSGTPPVYTYISQNRFFAMIPANETVGDMVLQWRSTTANNLVVRGNSDNNDTFSYNGLYTLLKDNAEMT